MSFHLASCNKAHSYRDSPCVHSTCWCTHVWTHIRRSKNTRWTGIHRPRCSALLKFWGNKRRPSCLCSKIFTCWASHLGSRVISHWFYALETGFDVNLSPLLQDPLGGIRQDADKFKVGFPHLRWLSPLTDGGMLKISDPQTGLWGERLAVLKFCSKAVLVGKSDSYLSN